MFSLAFSGLSLLELVIDKSSWPFLLIISTDFPPSPQTLTVPAKILRSEFNINKLLKVVAILPDTDVLSVSNKSYILTLDNWTKSLSLYKILTADFKALANELITIFILDVALTTSILPTSTVLILTLPLLHS